MPFSVEASTGVAVVDYRRAAGPDVLAVAEVMPQADDHAILTRAEDDARTRVTNDTDCGALVCRSGPGHPGGIRLRLHDERPANRGRVMTAIRGQYLDRLPAHFPGATEGRVRIRPARRLP
jgi:predicted nuclease of predicted toxin-antitoxin system